MDRRVVEVNELMESLISLPTKFLLIPFPLRKHYYQSQPFTQSKDLIPDVLALGIDDD